MVTDGRRHAAEERDRAQREGTPKLRKPRRHPRMSRLPDAVFVVDTRKEKIASMKRAS
jgi:ribosomal protein S2